MGHRARLQMWLVSRRDDETACWRLRTVLHDGVPRLSERTELYAHFYCECSNNIVYALRTLNSKRRGVFKTLLVHYCGKGQIKLVLRSCFG